MLHYYTPTLTRLFQKKLISRAKKVKSISFKGRMMNKKRVSSWCLAMINKENRSRSTLENVSMP